MALLGAFVLTQATAQKSLPPSAIPYAVNWPYTVVKAMHHAGFEMPTMRSATPSAAAQHRSNSALQPDSTITFYAYDFSGAGDSLPIFRTNYQYMFEDVKIETNLQYENGAWQKTNRTTLIYDQQQRLIEAFSEVYDLATETFLPDSYIEAFPHGNSATLLDSFIVSQWNPTIQDWNVLFTTANTFDQLDRTMVSLSRFYLVGEPIIVKDVHTYDAFGDNTLIESFGIVDSIEYAAGKQELKYRDHLLTQVVAFDSGDNGEFYQQSKITHEYTAFEKDSLVNTFAWSLELEDWSQIEEITYWYDSAQRVFAKETKWMQQDGSITDREVRNYAYKEEDNLALETFYQWNGDSYFLSDRQYFYYSGDVSDAPEQINPALPLVVAPNPTAGLVRLNLSEPALIQIYSTQGNLVNAGEYQPNASFDLVDLPNGLYFITARSANAVYAGRLVKQ